MSEANRELVNYLRREISLLRAKNQIMQSCLESISKLDFRLKKSPESLIVDKAISMLGEVEKHAKNGISDENRGIFVGGRGWENT